MGPTAIDHVLLAMPPGGEDRAREFYAGILGLSEVKTPAASSANGGAWFRSGDVELRLGVDADFRPATKAHPALRVRGLDQLATTARAYGSAVEWDDRYPGVRRCFVHDPFGNRIELIETEAHPQPTAGERALLRQLLGNLAYRTREALRGAPPGFADFEAGHGASTPKRLVRRMRGVLSAARAAFGASSGEVESLPSLSEEAAALEDAIIGVAAQIERGPWPQDLTPTDLLQGPIADAFTSAGQLTLLRRLFASSSQRPGSTSDGLTNRSMPQGQVIPELAYEDVTEAADWLRRAFGFKVRLRIGDHRVQLDYGTGSVVAIKGARTSAASSHGVMVRVDDVDAHFKAALTAGAVVLAAPTTYPYGERQYSAKDLGGHSWTFTQTIADVDPQTWGGEPGDFAS